MFLLYFDQINTALVRRDFLKKNLTDPKLLNSCVLFSSNILFRHQNNCIFVYNCLSLFCNNNNIFLWDTHLSVFADSMLDTLKMSG